MDEDKDELIAALVTRSLEARHGDEPVPTVEELCHEHPELVDDLRAALDVAERLPALQGAALSTDPLMGETIAGRYRIEERLGAGAMGVVWGAHDDELDRPVAIKVLAGALLSSEDSVARFHREAEALAAVRHESVVTVYDRGTLEDGSPFLVMERIEGVSLARLLDRAPEGASTSRPAEWIEERFGIAGTANEPFVRVATRWIAAVASGLEAAHAAGVIHRDIKPSNVLVRLDGRPVLLDFGIAAIEGHQTLTRSDAALGTPAYMAPEVLRGRGAPSAAQDVYGLTATLYHLVTLRAPYGGSPSQILTALATREPEPAGRIQPGLPRDLRAVLDAGMARSLGARYSDARALRSDLKALLELRSVSVRPVTPVTRAVRRVRRSKVVVGAALALALVGLFLGGRSIVQAQDRALTQRYQSAQAAVPANLTVVAPSQRRPADPADIAAILEVLDRLVATGREPVPSRALRASFALDQGKLEDAASDMARVARILGTPYARALAEAYAALGNDAAEDAEPTVMDLDLAQLPQPSAALDHYLAGYHELRQMRREEALALLSHEGLADVRHARELAALCLSLEIDKYWGAGQETERFAAADVMLRAGLAIESEFGWRSAMTRHLAVASLTVQRRWQDVLDVNEEAKQLSSRSLTTRQNAALAARMMGLLEVVRSETEVAMRLAPAYPPLHETLIRAESNAGHHANARELWEQATYRRPRDRDYLLALLLLNEGFDHRRVGELASALECASAAKESLLRGDPQRRSKKFQLAHALADALESNDEGLIFVALLREAIQEGLTVGLLRDLLTIFPDEIPEQATPDLAALLRRLLDSEQAKSLTAPVPVETRRRDG
ncbi:MAG: serine/threonine-protein kinase [Planctomycetota bacterium]